MDTDSAYIALAGDSIDDLVTKQHREHYFRHRSKWFPAECCDKHEDDYVQTLLAGLPWTATEACCVARKAYDKRKGLNKRQNDIDKDAFLAVLTNRRSGSGVNRGFRVRDSSVMTYVQERTALTYFYPKREVLADGLSTAPLDV